MNERYMAVRTSVLKKEGGQWLHFRELISFQFAKALANKMEKQAK